jgi:hypothetical protein
MGDAIASAAMPVPDWLHRDRLARVWDALAAALERRGLAATGTLTLRDLTRDERHALSDVLGRPVTDDIARVPLAELDVRMRDRVGSDLTAAVIWVTGRELVDRDARRRLAAERRDRPFEAAREWLLSRGPEPRERWVDTWLEGLRRDGVLTNDESGAVALITSLRLLDMQGMLTDADRPGDSPDGVGPRAAGPMGAGPRGAESGPARGPRVVSRTDLAAALTGSAHGLDDSTRLALIVLRAASARSGAHLPRSAADRRSLWESLGVVTDRVSTTCLTWNLQSSSLALGAPRHVTWWDLGDPEACSARLSVLVCENPRTLEAVAETGDSGPGVVCTMGQPNLVVREVLRRLALAGSDLRYHGDFDWPGLAIANACMNEFGVRPWLMSTADYQAGHGALELTGRSVEADWDTELGAVMRNRGVAVHEEAVLDTLLCRLPELVL